MVTILATTKTVQVTMPVMSPDNSFTCWERIYKLVAIRLECRLVLQVSSLAIHTSHPAT